MSNEFTQSVLLLFILINPFLVSVYLNEIIRSLSFQEFTRVLLRAMVISACGYALFAWGGVWIFRGLLQVRFAAFQVFGGLVFLIVALRAIVLGGKVITELRGDPAHLAGAIAMPFMIGPATMSASVLIGTRHSLWEALLIIVVATSATTVSLLILKSVHDHVRERHSLLIDRYMDIVGRISALVIGTIAMEMIFQGADSWLGRG